jgi:hypothetical protein
MKLFVLFLLGFTLLVPCSRCFAQETASTSCGVNSAVSLARLQGIMLDPQKLKEKYLLASVSLLDVKQMCADGHLQTSGVKAKVDELLHTGLPSIIGLKNPNHFTVLIDGTSTELRFLTARRGRPEQRHRGCHSHRQSRPVRPRRKARRDKKPLLSSGGFHFL